jgi:hypothetical protein
MLGQARRKWCLCLRNDTEDFAMTCKSPSPTLRAPVRNGSVASGLVLLAWLCAAATGCARDAVGPASVAALGPVFSTLASPATCPASPDFVVSTETDLRNAVLTAPPGSTIAINGMIALSTGIILIDRSDLHLTCAAQGAGLEVQPNSPTQRLIRIQAPRVSVTGLRLDGHLITLVNSSTVVVQSVGQVAEDVTLADNDITCGTRPCVVLNGTPRAMIARNRMVPAAGSGPPTYTFYAQSQPQYQPTVAEDVTLADNDMTCGADACAYLTGTPGAMIVRNQMAPAVGVATLHITVVQSVVGGATAEDVTFADNIMTCGSGSCVFFSGTPRAWITGNRLTAAAAVSGIHVQGSAAAEMAGATDGTRVEQNTVTATAPSTNGLFGGIRVRDGSGIVVTDNLVTGPWQNSVIITAVLGGEVARNELRGASQYGILFGSNNIPAVRPLVDGVAVRNNRVTGAGGGAGVQFTCRSVFVGNSLNGNVRGVEFFPESGANTLVGNGTIVFDNGAMDCDSDGQLDPNMISGAKRVQKGPPIGPVIGRAVSGAVSDMR